MVRTTRPALKEVLDCWNIATRELPPRRTSDLKVMDLVVDESLKAVVVRSQRTHNQFNYFERGRLSASIKAVSERLTPPSFAQPAGTQIS